MKINKIGVVLVSLMGISIAAFGDNVEMSVSGSLDWAEAVAYNVSINSPNLGSFISTCDAPEVQGWTGPYADTISADSYCAVRASASYGQYSWSGGFFGANDQIGSQLTEAPTNCGEMVLGQPPFYPASSSWTETCAANFSGTFSAGPPYQQAGPSFSGTLTGKGNITFDGYVANGLAFVNAFDSDFTGTADVKSSFTPTPELSSVWLMLTGAMLIGSAVMVRKIGAVEA